MVEVLKEFHEKSIFLEKKIQDLQQENNQQYSIQQKWASFTEKILKLFENVLSKV